MDLEDKWEHCADRPWRSHDTFGCTYSLGLWYMRAWLARSTETDEQNTGRHGWTLSNMRIMDTTFVFDFLGSRLAMRHLAEALSHWIGSISFYHDT